MPALPAIPGQDSSGWRLHVGAPLPCPVGPAVGVMGVVSAGGGGGGGAPAKATKSGASQSGASEPTLTLRENLLISIKKCIPLPVRTQANPS